MNRIKHITREDISSLFTKRDRDSNKGDFGYVGIIGGCPDYSGAVKLANMAQSALRAGCGVSRLIVPDSIRNAVMPYILESTLKSIPCDSSGMMEVSTEEGMNALRDATRGLKALAIGMGWGRSSEYVKILKYVLSELSLNLVIDADGLNTLADGHLDILRNTKCKVVLTPHLKEFSRLSSFTVDYIKENRQNAALQFAKDNNVILLLKGADTIITDGYDTVIVDRGCPGMATAGSGDVLSGILVGLLGYLPLSVLSVAAGAYINGLAGEYASGEQGEISMLAGDTVKHIPQAVRAITKGI